MIARLPLPSKQFLFVLAKDSLELFQYFWFSSLELVSWMSWKVAGGTGIFSARVNGFATRIRTLPVGGAERVCVTVPGLSVFLWNWRNGITRGAAAHRKTAHWTSIICFCNPSCWGLCHYFSGQNYYIFIILPTLSIQYFSKKKVTWGLIPGNV